MATVTIEHPTSLSGSQIRERVVEVMRRVEQKYGLSGTWNGNRYVFSRSGVDGSAIIEDGMVRVSLKLGLMLSAFRGVIESELRSRLRERLP